MESTNIALYHDISVGTLSDILGTCEAGKFYEITLSVKGEKTIELKLQDIKSQDFILMVNRNKFFPEGKYKFRFFAKNDSALVITISGQAGAIEDINLHTT